MKLADHGKLIVEKDEDGGFLALDDKGNVEWFATKKNVVAHAKKLGKKAAAKQGSGALEIEWRS